MNYELNYFPSKNCELNFEGVHVEYELSQHGDKINHLHFILKAADC